MTSQTIKKIAEMVGGMKETLRKRKYPLQPTVNKVTEREEFESQSEKEPIK